MLTGLLLFVNISSGQTIDLDLTVPSACGNGTCDNGETCSTCSTDCGSCGGSGEPPTPSDTTAPVISSVATSNITANSATVTWTATDNSSLSGCTFVYGENLGSSATPTNNGGNFTVNLSSLAPSTAYAFLITCTDASGNSAQENSSFQTSAGEDTTAPTISDILATPSLNGAAITWTTNEAADSQVDYGLTTNYGQSVNDVSLLLSHGLNLSNLLPATLYNYRILSADASGNRATSANQTFTTLNDTVPPTEAGNYVLTTTTNSIVLSWTNPLDNDFSKVILLRKIGGRSTSPSDGTIIYEGAGATKTDTNIQFNIIYFYTLYTVDTSNNHSSGIFLSGKITPPPNQEICTNGVDDDEDTKIDCADTDCAAADNCTSHDEVCNNGIDDDRDNKIDCADTDCVNDASCREPTPEICNNSIDDDSDGKIDCADSDCASSSACAPPVTEVCDNGQDDDGDNQIDCADSNCSSFPSCTSDQGGSAACNNGQDDDGDAKIDFPSDPGCISVDDTDEYNPDENNMPDEFKITLSSLYFFGGLRNISLPFQSNIITSLANSRATLKVNAKNLTTRPEKVTFYTASNKYELDRTNDFYIVDFTFPKIGRHDSYLELDYGAGQIDSLAIILNSLPSGLVIGDDNTSLTGAEVTISPRGGGSDVAENYGQNSRLYTDVNGLYGWVMPNGFYELKIIKDSYYDETKVVKITNNVVNENVSLVLKPEKLENVIDPEASITENISNVAKNIGEKSKATFKRSLKTAENLAKDVDRAKDDPGVEKVAREVVAPGATAVVAVGAVPLISWGSIWPLLRFIFLQPTLLLGRKKRQAWGMVYNSLNKLPLDLVIVRLLNAKTNKVLQTKVTDKQGRFIFWAEPGEYLIEAQKGSMKFPSALLAGFQQDGHRGDIYHGEKILVTQEEANISPNVPLDPGGAIKTPARLKWERAGRIIQNILAWLGLAVTAASLYVTPAWYMWVLLVAHFVLFLLFRRLAVPPKPKNWGMVSDETNKNPLRQVVARLFSAQFNKLVATEVTDRKGRYNFLVGDGEYFVTYDKPEYVPHKTEVIDTGKEEEKILAKNISLRKKVNGLSTVGKTSEK